MTLLKRYEQELDYCSYCPKLCTFSCPVSAVEKNEAYTPWAKMTLLNLLRKGLVEVEPETVEPLYHCLACRLCTTYCRHGNEVGEALTAGRAWLSERGMTHPALERLKENLFADGNTYGRDLKSVLEGIGGGERLVDDAQVLYFPGEAVLAERPEEMTRTFRIFDKFSIDFVACYPGPYFSSGMPLYRAGFLEDFESYARTVFESLAGKKLIIAASAEDAYALKALYLEFGFNLAGKVRHVLEFLDPYLKNAVFEKRVEKQAAYHDSAYLGRYLGMYEEPRAVLSRLTEEKPVEMVWNREGAFSCGRLGSFAFTHPGEAALIARERLRQAAEVGAELLVTASPEGAVALEGVRGKGDPEVRTLIDVIFSCL